MLTSGLKHQNLYQEDLIIVLGLKPTTNLFVQSCRKNRGVYVEVECLFLDLVEHWLRQVQVGEQKVLTVRIKLQRSVILLSRWRIDLIILSLTHAPTYTQTHAHVWLYEICKTYCYHNIEDKSKPYLIKCLYLPLSFFHTRYYKYTHN